MPSSIKQFNQFQYSGDHTLLEGVTEKFSPQSVESIALYGEVEGKIFLS